MRTQQIHGIILLLGILISAFLLKALSTKAPVPRVEEARIRYEIEKIRVQQSTLRRNDRLKYYGILSLLATINCCLLIMAGSYAKTKISAASIHTAQIGQHSAIPVHHRDLQYFYPIAMNLSLAELESSTSTTHEEAYQISRQMIEDITGYPRALAGRQELAVLGARHSDHIPALVPFQASVPPFAELLSAEILAPGTPLILGYSQGQPQYRSLQELKSLAIAGWQGSGKTRSMAYLVASSVLAYGIHAYIVDPHRNHQDSLSSLLTPLEQTGNVTIINPFDTPDLLMDLQRRLGRRLSGQEATIPGILLVIDELARLAKTEYFNLLITMLERCTEETRKANMTFIGGSPKWTARHFKGRADIRGCMNSMLIHKTKPSQADLLLEDAHDKHLVKHLHQPGEAILVTDYSSPVVVSVPFCTRQDMETVADLISNKGKQYRSKTSSTTTIPTQHRTPQPPAAMIQLDQHRKKYKAAWQRGLDPMQLTVEMILDRLVFRKQQEPGFTQSELANQMRISPGYLSKILREQRPLTDDLKQKFSEVLFARKEQPRLAMTG